MKELLAYLNANPLQSRFSMPTVWREDNIADSDLALLRFLPELELVVLYGAGDGALSHLSHLHSIADLSVSSDKITGNCLNHVRRLKSLRSIDFISCRNISTEAFEGLVKELPNLSGEWPPRKDALP